MSEFLPVLNDHAMETLFQLEWVVFVIGRQVGHRNEDKFKQFALLTNHIFLYQIPMVLLLMSTHHSVHTNAVCH